MCNAFFIWSLSSAYVFLLCNRIQITLADLSRFSSQTDFQLQKTPSPASLCRGILNFKLYGASFYVTAAFFLTHLHMQSKSEWEKIQGSSYAANELLAVRNQQWWRYCVLTLCHLPFCILQGLRQSFINPQCIIIKRPICTVELNNKAKTPSAHSHAYHTILTRCDVSSWEFRNSRIKTQFNDVNICQMCF